jgi:hypothetical protein
VDISSLARAAQTTIESATEPLLPSEELELKEAEVSVLGIVLLKRVTVLS